MLHMLYHNTKYSENSKVFGYQYFRSLQRMKKKTVALQYEIKSSVLEIYKRFPLCDPAENLLIS